MRRCVCFYKEHPLLTAKITGRQVAGRAISMKIESHLIAGHQRGLSAISLLYRKPSDIPEEQKAATHQMFRGRDTSGCSQHRGGGTQADRPLQYTDTKKDCTSTEGCCSPKWRSGSTGGSTTSSRRQTDEATRHTYTTLKQAQQQ